MRTSWMIQSDLHSDMQEAFDDEGFVNGASASFATH